MKSRILVTLCALAVVLFSVGSSWADNFTELSFSLESGIREDSLDWNIADSDGSPNVLSELEWDDLEIYQVGFTSKLIVENGKVPFATYIRLKADYGWITDGEVRDSDYRGDNRSEEYSRSISDGDDGEVWDASIGGGFQFSFFNDCLKIAPLVGYSQHQQDLSMQDGLQVIGNSVVVPTAGTALSDLNSSYDTEWHGPWIGVDIAFVLGTRFLLEGSFEYHYVDYDAEANWNLREDFAHPKSFEHEAEADGIVTECALSFLLSNHWTLTGKASYSNWETNDGDDTTFLADGSVAVTTLNEVNWESYSFMLGISYDFF